jgi:hypothetical protein
MRSSILNILYTLLFITTSSASYSQSVIMARHLEKIAYDSDQQHLIVYGGAEFNQGKVSFPSNVSTWNGDKWNITEVDGPGTRAGHSLIYHEHEKALYLVSGIKNDSQGEHVILDVWRWKENKWTVILNDAPMKTSDGAYDHVNKSLLVFGDVHNKTKAWDGGDPQRFELWELKDNRWKKLSADGPQPEGPYEVAFDRERRALIIPVWDNGRSFVWEWRDNKWMKIQAKGDFPEARNRFALAYDDVTKTTYMFGGRNDSTEYFSDFWKWDGTQWKRIELENSPAGRAGATMESGFGGLILYGGVTEKGPCNEIWSWKNNTWKKHQ